MVLLRVGDLRRHSGDSATRRPTVLVGTDAGPVIKTLG